MEKKGNSPIVTFRLERDILKALTEAAAQRRLSRSELIRKAIEREVQRESKQK